MKKIKIPKELTSAIAINSYLVCMEEYLANKEKLKKKRRKARKYKVNEIKNNGGEK